MGRLREFIRRERVYVLLLILIALVSLAQHHAEKGVTEKAGIKADNAESRIKALEEEGSAKKIKEKLASNAPLRVYFSVVVFFITFAFFSGVFLTAIFILRKISGKSVISRRVDSNKAAWRVWDVCKVAVLFILFGYIVSAVEAAVISFIPHERLSGNFITAFNTTLMDLAAVLFILYFVVSVYGQKISSLGITSKEIFRNIVTGVAGYVTLIPSFILVLFITVAVTKLLRYTPPKQPVFDLFLEEKSAAMLIYSTILVAFIGPVLEEVFFRGFFYNALKNRFGILCSALISASLFSVLHANIVAFFSIFLLGMLLAYLYEKTGSLVSSITVHVMHNTAMVSLLFLLKELSA
ncbi:MAG: hypothetical protein AUJ75_03770 [Candidatus Omnitrophica bacterium CG1_02_49_10]|nr:MAG: hypothetical protein AUJ75_03770 [Candidatus Omnitrophica bacterium CG1_02_49_10]